jgi:hypothetical protein
MAICFEYNFCVGFSALHTGLKGAIFT